MSETPTTTRLTVPRTNPDTETTYVSIVANGLDDDGKRIWGVEARMDLSLRWPAGGDITPYAEVGHPTGGVSTNDGIRARAELILTLCDIADVVNRWFATGVTIDQAVEALVERVDEVRHLVDRFDDLADERV